MYMNTHECKFACTHVPNTRACTHARSLSNTHTFT